MTRYNNLERIQQLDPVKDHAQIVHLIGGYEFPWDSTRALEIALFRTYCVPSISALLDKTGEFQHHTQKRYDDTGIIISEILKWGYDSDRGRQAIERMNKMHGRFKISNADFLYVLSTFIYEPIRWIDRFGWRKMCEQERLASYNFWREVGVRMNIQNIPPTYEEFEQYNLNYEREYFRYSDTNRHVGEATRNLFLSWFPSVLRPMLKPIVHSLLDETMLDAFGFSHPPKFLKLVVANMLKMRGKILRVLPPRKNPNFFVDESLRSYPNGYELADVGATYMLESLNRSKESDEKNL